VEGTMAHQDSNHKKVYVLEEQEIYHHLYRASFDGESPFKLAGMSSNVNPDQIEKILADSDIGILVRGVKTFNGATCEEITLVQSRYPRLGIIVLMISVGTDEAILIRKLLQKSRSGIAFYLKSSLDSVEQLRQIVQAVSHGQVVLDPAVTNQIMTEKAEFPFLKSLTNRELEILNLLANGYTNAAIAQTLFIDVKTVEHHLNSIYSKLKEDADFNQRHPRVSVARMYLETTGELVVNSKPVLPTDQ
jgi:DNA-binding NarL/FixJ family response regulator